MTAMETRLQHYVEVIQRANAIAARTELDDLLDAMLALLIDVTQASAGTLYLYNANDHTLEFKVVHGNPASTGLVGTRIAANRGVAGAAVQQREPIFVADVTADPRWDRALGELAGLRLRTMYCLPLLLHNEPIGVVQVFNLAQTTIDDPDELALIELLCQRLVTEVEKARLLNETRRRERRQQALVEIVTKLTSTLERDELLSQIMAHACELLDVEATSIWLRDENGDLLLHLASGEGHERMEARRVPAGQGIIGHVVETGTTVVVNDAQQDPRFYRAIDAQSGFVTEAILCVPLRAPRILVGGERGEISSAIIGGAQALNPRHSTAFDAEAISLFETLAGQAATVIRLSALYAETDTLFTRLIDAITGAIDLKDPYTRGHSQRVSDFSVAIARELGLPEDVVYRIRIASRLHDVGKIRIPDSILKKPGRLDDTEFGEMRKHPTYGLDFLRDNSLLEIELLRDSWQALAQHHERLDGQGYPAGLAGAEISQVGRIVAVADVFDALTSHRPYRKALTVEQALAILHDGAGDELDPDCVAALERARQRNLIKTQDER